MKSEKPPSLGSHHGNAGPRGGCTQRWRVRRLGAAPLLPAPGPTSRRTARPLGMSSDLSSGSGVTDSFLEILPSSSLPRHTFLSSPPAGFWHPARFEIFPGDNSEPAEKYTRGWRGPQSWALWSDRRRQLALKAKMGFSVALPVL